MNLLERKFTKEIAAAGLSADGEPGAVVTEADLAPLPPAAQRYLRFMRVAGRPRDTSFRLHLRCRFRPRLDGGWLDGEVWQYNSQPDLARYFYMTLRMFGVPVLGRDIYAAGKGRMLIRPLDLFTVEDAQGPELDIGELVTYLNDAVLLAPTMLLEPRVSWAGVDERSFDVSLTDRETTVTGRVSLDERGAVIDFSTTDRFHERVRTRWSTPIDGWQEIEGRMLPTTGRAVWHFPDRDFTYVELRFEPGDITYNVPPAMPAR